MNQTRARELVGQISGRRIAVVGDLMLDRYIWGDARRISQEAPVPVVEVSRTSAAPGGAANVARNLAVLGAQAAAYGVIGDDAAAGDLARALADERVDVSNVLCDPQRVTTEKTRVIAGHQQVVRVDNERATPVSTAHESMLIERLATALETRAVDGIVVEDYAKGTVSGTLLTRITQLARDAKIPIALDPHPGSRACTRGLSVITPNRAEAYAMAGVYARAHAGPAMEDDSFHEVVRILQDRWAPECLLITLGAEGMALFRADAAPLLIPTRAREVFDVSGAGDTVIATFLLALVAGAAPDEAAHLANHAAGVVVGKLGTASVTPDELLATFDADGA